MNDREFLTSWQQQVEYRKVRSWGLGHNRAQRNTNLHNEMIKRVMTAEQIIEWVDQPIPIIINKKEVHHEQRT